MAETFFLNRQFPVWEAEIIVLPSNSILCMELSSRGCFLQIISGLLAAKSIFPSFDRHYNAYFSCL
jgi:hypothetical protein